MLRLTNRFRNLSIAKESFEMNYASNLQVRWRKPRWVPTAKSKVFRVPARHITPEDEKVELKRLYNIYQTQIKSIRRYLTYKYCTRFSASTDPEEHRRIFQEEFARCKELNDQWNEEQKVIREKRLTEILETDLDYARKRLELELLKQEEDLEEIEDIVRREKAESLRFILPENIDTAIDHALANPVDYNFAIDMNGEKIEGRDNNPQIQTEKVQVSQ